MADNTYAISQIVGTSPESLDTAIRNGLARASQTVRHLDWFEVDEIRGELADEGQVNHFQVVLRVGFRMED